MFRITLPGKKPRPRIAVTAAIAVCATIAAGLPGTAQAAAEVADEPVAPDRAGLSAAAHQSADLAADQQVTLARTVLEELDAQGATDFWVDFEDQADLSRAAGIDDWAERGQYVYDQLVETAKASQAELTLGLTALGVEHEAFWISNAVLVHGGDQAVLDDVLRHAEVAAVRADEAIDLPDPIEEPTSGAASVAAVEWGIANIRADQVWSQLGVRGEDIVVANIDTGVDYTHPALVNQYRGNLGDGEFTHDYNWWDPSNVCPLDEPCDNHGHGTHTMGTMVGDDGAANQVGVAPGAQWIAAKGCEARDCSAAALLASGQFLLAPTKLDGTEPRPDLRPHVINNSWGSANGSSVEPFYRDLVNAWTAAGIFGVFSNGNAGPGCDTTGSPADYVESWGVGAYDRGNTIASFSSRGPGEDGEIRPNISAPGVDVRSSFPGNQYATASGTSMAAPHVAGAIALMWSASTRVGDIEGTREALAATATDTADDSCGGTAENNNVYGEGRLDAYEATIRFAVESGVAGVVTDRASGQPLAGVTVTGTDLLDRVTGQDGRYTLRALPGSYTLEFAKFGYLPHTEPDVVVTEDSFTSLDVALEPAGTGAIAGTVTDGRSGHTIPDATVRLLDVPVDLSATTDANGDYELSGVPVGTYDLQVTTSRPGQWWPAGAEVTVTEDATARVDVGVPRAGGVDWVSITSDGGEVSAKQRGGQISADGRYVTFRSSAQDLVDAPIGEGGYHTFVHDRRTGTTELVPGSSSQSSDPTISGDGRYVAVSGPPNLLEEQRPEAPPLPLTWPTLDDQERAYVFDRATGELELVSVNSHGETVGNLEPDIAPVITPDGRHAAFVSQSPQLVDEALPECNAVFELQLDRCLQVAVHDRGSGQTEVVSVSSAGELANSSWARSDLAMTPDGRTVAFTSRATNLVGEQTNPGNDIFVRDRDTGATEWVSVLGPVGPFSSIGDPVISADGTVVAYGRGFATGVVYDRTTSEAEVLPQPRDYDEPFFAVSGVAQLSADGRFVTYFNAALVPGFGGALPGSVGMFRLDRETDHVELIRPFDYDQSLSISSQDLTPDGRYLLLRLDSPLVPGDGNGVEDLYVLDLEHDAQQPRALFAVWDLSVRPARPRPGQPVEVTAKVKNVGDVAGDYQAALLVDNVPEPSASRTVSLAPGEVSDVSFTVARQAGGEHRVRIGQAAGAFRVQAGTLAGEVTDANDANPVEGAAVTAVRGDITRTTRVLDRSYRLDGLSLGTWTVTVEATDYATETFQVTLTDDGQQVTRDLTLRTGVATPDRDRIALSVSAGGAQTIEFSVANPGTADLSLNAFGWRATVPEEPSVLMYTSANSTDTHIDRALRGLGLEYTAVREENECKGGLNAPPFDGLFQELPEALANGRWDLVIVDQWCATWALPQPVAEALNTHVAQGGRLIIRSETLGSRCCVAYPLWETLGVQLVGSPGGRGHFGSEHFPVRWWDSEHPLFTAPLAVPEFDSGRTRGGAGPGRELLAVADGFDGLAGYTLTERPDHAALVLGNDDRTLYNGFWYGDWSTVPGESGPVPDVDGDGIPDGVELWTNSIVHVGGLGVQRWLQVEHSGTIAPGDGAGVAVSVDASNLAPGTYRGTVSLATDAAREPLVTIPLTLEVTACDRTINDRHVGRLTVDEGVTCVADGARVVGPVRVAEGAGLVVGDASITGPVTTDGAQVVQLTGSKVAGPVRVRGTTGSVHISGVRLAGPLTVVDNITGDSLVVISGSAIAGSLACHGNDPAPVDLGAPNTVTGRTSGQCAGMVMPVGVR